MGIGITVGILADMLKLRDEGEDRYDPHLEDFHQINRVPAHHHLAPHHEPTSCEIRSWDLYSASGLHSLRRVAAYLDRTEKLPEGESDTADDAPVLRAYYDTAQEHPHQFD